MRHILQLKTSLFANHGQSNQLADKFVASLTAKHAQAQVVTRDLAHEPIPHLDAAGFQSFIAKPEDRTPEQQARVDFSDALVAELKTADVIVLGLPMYNLGIPSTLKSWIDQVARAGITFRYTEKGPQGLLSGKKVYVFATRGGVYAGSAFDTQTGYIKNIFAFIGITDVEFVYAEGLNMGDEARSKALAGANDELDRIAA